MADPILSDPEIWTSPAAAAIAAGITAAAMLLWIAIMRRRSTRVRLRQSDRQDKVVTRFKSASPLHEATEQLSDRGNLEVRVAAVEILKQLARQSPRNYWAVMEVLTKHLRRYARAPIKRGQPLPSKETGADIAPDIQAILSLFLHRDPQHENRNQVLDLRNTDLSRTDLRGIFLRYADLSGSALIGTALRNANLRDANLEAARLDGASLRGADLRGADFSKASLRSADLRYSDMRGVILNNMTDLIHADLSNADLRGASLEDAVLCEATLSQASLRGAIFIHADLMGAALDEA